MSRWEGQGTPTSLVINLELSHGRHGASARVELRSSDWAEVAIGGWIDRIALQRLRQMFGDLAARGVRRLALDCSQLRHIEYRLIPVLRDSLAPFGSDGQMVRGLSHRLGDVFRLAGWNTGGPARAGAAGPIGTKREWAS